MNHDKLQPYLPMALAVGFFALALFLYFWFPASVWSITDNETHGLGNAINMAYRLADRQLYDAPGFGFHPGVTFYLMSWLALALSGHPIATGGLSFFNTVIDDAQTYHKMAVCLASFVGAAGVYIFVRTSRALVPMAAIVTGLLLWIVSTPATMLMFMSPGFESFALVINALFLAVLVPLARESEIDPAIVILAGCVGALAYLNKLSYIYILVGLGAALVAKVVLSGTGWKKGSLLISLLVASFLLVTLAIGLIIIGWSGLKDVLIYHQEVILGSGLYGEGSQTVVSGGEIWRAIKQIPLERAYAMPIAVGAGAFLLIGGCVEGIRRRTDVATAVLSIGTGTAALLSAIIVVKHYELHYTAGISAALPACVIASHLLLKALRVGFSGFKQTVVSGLGIVAMAGPVASMAMYVLAGRSENTRLALADRADIAGYAAGIKGVTDFAYRVPFPQYGEGFVIHLAGIPSLTYEFLQHRRGVTNSFTERLVTEDVKAYVVDKTYFRDVAAVKGAANLDLQGPKAVRYEDGDRLFELRTVFVLLKK